MKSDLARKLLADLRECPALYPYADPAVLNSQRAQPLAARVTAVRIDTAAMLADAVFATPVPGVTNGR